MNFREYLKEGKKKIIKIKPGPKAFAQMLTYKSMGYKIVITDKMVTAEPPKDSENIK